MAITFQNIQSDAMGAVNVGQLAAGGNTVGAIGGGAELGLSTAQPFLTTGTTAAQAVPIAGAILAAGLAIVNIFSQHHKAAVAAEAKALDVAVPNAIAEMTQIYNALNSGQITKAQAAKFFDQVVSTYYASFGQGPQGQVLQKSGPCGVKCPTHMQSMSGPATTPGAPCTVAKPHTCNGPCYIGCYVIEVWAEKAKWTLGIAPYDPIAPGEERHFGGDQVLIRAGSGVVNVPIWSYTEPIPVSTSLVNAASDAGARLSSVLSGASPNSLLLIGLLALGSVFLIARGR